MCERTAWRICRENQWWSVFGKKRGKNGKRPGPPVHDDLVKRGLTAEDKPAWADCPPIGYEVIMNRTVSLAAQPQLTPDRAAVPVAVGT